MGPSPGTVLKFTREGGAEGGLFEAAEVGEGGGGGGLGGFGLGEEGFDSCDDLALLGDGGRVTVVCSG